MSGIDAAYDDAINLPSNRGNKTRLNAEFVREGALGYMNHEQFYRKVSWLMFTSYGGCGPYSVYRKRNTRGIHEIY